MYLRYLALGLLTGAMLLVPRDAVALSEPDPVTCEGYVEKRVYLENQSWVEPQPDNGSGHPGTGKQGHIHVGTCFPLHQDVTSEILELDIRLQLHNVPGRPTRLQISTYGMGGASGKHIILNPIPRCETTDCDQWVHVEFPLGTVTESGWTDFGIWLWVDMEDGHTWYNVNKWAFNVVNGAPPRTSSPGADYPRIGGNTWLTELVGAHRTNYSEASIATEDFPWDFTTGQLIPLSGVWKPKVMFHQYSAFWATTNGMAMIDPKLHAIPADHGTMVYDGPGGAQQLSINTTQLSNGPHRLLLAACDPRPDGIHHCGVLVVPFVVDNPMNPMNPLAGDFNNDGRDDIAHYRSSTGNWTVSRSTGTGFTNSTWTTFSAVSGWTEHLVGDFNGDGRDDIAHYRPSTGNWTVSRSTGTGFTNSTWTTFISTSGWTEHLVGDFNNDGRDDIAHYRGSTGNWTVSRSTGSGFVNSTWTNFSAVSGWTEHLVGDFNNDGRDDIAHYRPSTGNWTVSRSTGSGFTNSTWTTFTSASGWTEHLVGDFNNDGRDDIAHYRPTTGNWTVSRSTGTGFTNSTWTTFTSASGWTEHLVGDFNNDSRDDIAHYRPSTGNWTVSRSTGTGFTNSTWTTFTALSGWTEHLVGDFNNDSRDDIAHYRPSTGNWTVSRSTGTGFTNSTWTYQ